MKGYKYKIPLLWGIDYATHDIPIALLATAESFKAWSAYFQLFRIINHYPMLIVSDDNTALKTAARFKFPNSKIQTCYNHFKESIRRDLRVRTDPTYKSFSVMIDHALKIKRSEQDFNKKLNAIFQRFKHDQVCTKIIVDIEKRKHEFLAFAGFKSAPVTNNLIECYNSHLEARLASIKGFESFQHAKLWINGYILKRRYTRLTGCNGKFRYLNGCFPLEKSKKQNVELPTLF